MRSQVYLHNFNYPDPICIVNNVSNMKRKKSVYELFDDINHIKMQ